jgi:hypothetical protein
MTERAIVCPGCGEAVPYGRLSCPECGTLLASVAGGVRPTVRTADAPDPGAAATPGGDGMEPALDPVADEPPPEPARLRAARKSASAAVAGAYVPPSTTPPSDPPLAPVTSGRVGAGALPPPRGKGDAQTKAAAAAAPPPVAASPALVAATAASAEAAADEPAAAVASALSPDPDPAPDETPAATPAAIEALVPPVAPAGAATPAPMLFPPATLVAAGPTVGAPTLAYAAAAPAASIPATSAAASSVASADAGSSDELAWLDPGLDWATVAGSGLIVIGMLLPWSRTVIGASGVGYFDTWGLAGPLHLVVFFWALAVAGLSIVRKPAPPWVRSGLAGLALGAFALGLAWPYLFGPLGAGIGVLAVAVGSFVLIATGVLAAWRARHADVEPPV